MANKSMVDIAEHVVARAEDILPQFTEAAIRGIVWDAIGVSVALGILCFAGAVFIVGFACIMFADGDTDKAAKWVKRHVPIWAILFALMPAASQIPVFIDPAAVLAYRLIN